MTWRCWCSTRSATPSRPAASTCTWTRGPHTTTTRSMPPITSPSTEYTCRCMSDFSPGLEGVLAARTVISMVDGQNGRLVFRGYVIADLAEDMSYEEVAYLLWHGELPTRTQLAEISDRLRSKRNLNPAAHAALKSLAADTHPMDVLRTVVSAQGATSRLVKPDIDQAIENVAVFPTLLAAFHRQRQGKEWLGPRGDLGDPPH